MERAAKDCKFVTLEHEVPHPICYYTIICFLMKKNKIIWIIVLIVIVGLVVGIIINLQPQTSNNNTTNQIGTRKTTENVNNSQNVEETNTFNQISEYLDDLGYTWEMSKVITLKNFDTEAKLNRLKTSFEFIF